MSRTFHRHRTARFAPRPSSRRAKKRRAARIHRAWTFLLRETGSVLAKVVSFAAIVAVFLLVLLDDTEVVFDQLDPRLQDWITARLGGPEIDVGSIGFSLGAGEEPAGLTLNNVEIGGTESSPRLTMPRLETEFSVMDGMLGQIRPRSLTVSGTQIALTRLREGGLLLSASPDDPDPIRLLGRTNAPPPDPARLLARVADLAQADMLSELRSVTLEDLAFNLRDAASGRAWTTQQASARLTSTGDGLSASLRATFPTTGSQPLALTASFAQSMTTGLTRIAVDFDQARPSDIAGLVDVLDWLAVIDAPVDGSLALELDRDGGIEALSGRLAMGRLRVGHRRRLAAL